MSNNCSQAPGTRGQSGPGGSCQSNFVYDTTLNLHTISTERTPYYKLPPVPIDYQGTNTALAMKKFGVAPPVRYSTSNTSFMLGNSLLTPQYPHAYNYSNFGANGYVTQGDYSDAIMTQGPY